MAHGCNGWQIEVISSQTKSSGDSQNHDKPKIQSADFDAIKDNTLRHDTINRFPLNRITL
jgi:hypothetical protein